MICECLMFHRFTKKIGGDGVSQYGVSRVTVGVALHFQTKLSPCE